MEQFYLIGVAFLVMVAFLSLLLEHQPNSGSD